MLPNKRVDPATLPQIRDDLDCVVMMTVPQYEFWACSVVLQSEHAHGRPCCIYPATLTPHSPESLTINKHVQKLFSTLHVKIGNHATLKRVSILKKLYQKKLWRETTGLHFKKAYTHSGTSCPQCVYLLPSQFVISNVCKSGIHIGDRKYLNEYTPFWSVSLWILLVNKRQDPIEPECSCICMETSFLVHRSL